MRTIKYETIVATVAKLCIGSCHELPNDVLFALEDARGKETNPRAARIIEKLIENAKLASSEMIPICQDTGLSIVFVEKGSDVFIVPPKGNPTATIDDAINAGVELGYKDGLLRKSVVSEPLNKRENTRTNTPAIIHHFVTSGDKLKLSLMTKGGGCENKSQFKMFNPTEDKSTIIDWIRDVVVEAGANACPPFVIGVGIGGDFEQCCLISKKALLRKLDDNNSDKFYADMEREILSLINASSLGAQGLGGDTTVLAVKIETAPCHIASLPVAVNIECHAHRHKEIVL